MQARRRAQRTATNRPSGLAASIEAGLHTEGPPKAPARCGAKRIPDFSLRSFPGGQEGEETPVPIPNTEVKGPVAEGTGRFAPGRVGSRRDFFSGGRRVSAGPLFLLMRRYGCQSPQNKLVKEKVIMARKAFLLIMLALFCGCVKSAEKTKTRREFTIMTFNIRHGRGMDNKVDLSRAASIINDAKPRFVGICEIDCKARRTNGDDQPQTLAGLCGMKATFGKAIDFQGGGYGVAVLSDVEPLSSRTVPLPGAEPRVLLLCEFEDCVIGVTHLSVSKESERTESVKLIREAIAESNKPVFVMGDWNSLPNSTVLTGMREYLKVLSDEQARTYHGHPSNGPSGTTSDFCIDYIAVDNAHADPVQVLERVTVPDEIVSDHKAIAVKVAL